VTKNDGVSKEMAQKMWYSLQSQGIPASFITMNTLFPVSDEINEATTMFRRSGGRSLISVGDASATDFTKLIRKSVETHTSIDKFLRPWKLVPSSSSAVSVPHLAVTTSPSVNHFLSSSMILHSEEDVLFGLTSSTPNVSIFFFFVCS
jgi:alcohol dehydrogenase class IV